MRPLQLITREHLLQRHSLNGLVVYAFDSLEQSAKVVHAVSTRHGGVSPVPFDSLNLSNAVGDEPANVAANLAHLHDALGLDGAATVTANQAQADRIAVVDAALRGTRVAGVDALLTKEPGVPLLLRFADCVPILFLDTVHDVVGVAHAGWRGTVARVAAKTACRMFETFGTRPADLLACIGPSIGPCCYQVGEEVVRRVRTELEDADALLIGRDGATFFDLWQANARQLQSLGVDRIEVAGVCTADHTNDFFSWRAEQGKTGRFGAVLALKGQP